MMGITTEELAALRHRPYVVRKRPRENWFYSGKYYEIVYNDETVVYETFVSGPVSFKSIENLCDAMNAAYSAGVADTMARFITKT